MEQQSVLASFFLFDYVGHWVVTLALTLEWSIRVPVDVLAESLQNEG